MTKNKTRGLKVTRYVSKGAMLVLREALPPEDPDSIESLWVKRYGSLDGFPWEELGKTPPEGRCPACGKPIGEDEE